MITNRIVFLFFIGLCCFHGVFGQKIDGNKIWVSYIDSVNDGYGYKNLYGDIIIPAGKYSFCFTDTFRTYAIVSLPPKGFVAIDRKENILYTVFPFDNGPDYVEDGFFRIVKEEKLAMQTLQQERLLSNRSLPAPGPLKKARRKSP
jgi:hypothetical protein